MLVWLVFLPLLGGFVSWLFDAYLQRSFTQIRRCDEGHVNHIGLMHKLCDKFSSFAAGWVALIFAFSSLVITCTFILEVLKQDDQSQNWCKVVEFDWIPLLGIRFHLVLDGLALLMILISLIVTIIAIIYSFKERPNSSGFFYFSLLLMLSAVIMLFVVADLFLFLLLWEATSIPVYFLIALWGRRDSNAQLRFNGASKFLIYTQVSSLIMLIAIVSLALVNWKLTNTWTFDSSTLMNTPISSRVEFLIMLGFLFAFLVRIPLLPFHSWFIQAHIESSTTTSIMISGLIVNTAIYGLLRLVIPLFPNASLMITPIMLALAIITLFYAAILCFNQNDIKRLIAYIHIGLMSLMTSVLYSGSLKAYQGMIIDIVAISLVIVGLFIISGLLVERYSTRNINHFIALKQHVKYLSTLTLFFILAVLGVPGTANFVANFMMFLGSYESSTYLGILLIIGLSLLSISLIIRIQPIFYGTTDKQVMDKKNISFRDLSLLILILVMLFAIGLYPQWLLDLFSPTISKIQQIFVNAQINLIKGDV